MKNPIVMRGTMAELGMAEFYDPLGSETLIGKIEGTPAERTFSVADGFGPIRGLPRINEVDKRVYKLAEDYGRSLEVDLVLVTEIKLGNPHAIDVRMRMPDGSEAFPLEKRTAHYDGDFFLAEEVDKSKFPPGATKMWQGAVDYTAVLQMFNLKGI